MPLTLPLLRNGSLPLPASRARGVWAVLGRDMAGQRCVNPIAARAGIQGKYWTGYPLPVVLRNGCRPPRLAPEFIFPGEMRNALQTSAPDRGEREGANA